jgi:drug/metabolite transporter (DMT)-like permease
VTAVLLALASALTYGCSDFVGGLVARRSSAWAVAVLAQSSSVLCTAAVALFLGGAPHADDLRWAVLAGASSGVGTGFLYRGLATGRMAVVAPVSAVGAAVVPVLAGAATGERLPVLTWCGVLAALPAIALVSRVPAGARPGHQPGRPPRRVPEGLADGLLAGAGFGSLFVALGQVPASAGGWPLVLCQLVSIPAVALLATVLRAPWVPRGRYVRWAVLAGPLGASANGLFLLSTQRGYLSVAGVIASLYPASTVLLAALALRERVHRTQGLGLGLCAVAVTLVALG